MVEVDLSKVRPTVAFPHLPGNAKTIDEIEAMEPIKIDQVVIGSCTNGRMEDMRRAAAILKGHKVHPDVRVMVIPGTQKIYKECIKEGLVDIFIDAGCAFNTPSCGPAWEDIWESLRRERNAYLQRTGILSEEWGMWTP